ncbi:MAG: T9SS type A sorting domain-containing protein [Cytophagaceae bacterium]
MRRSFTIINSLLSWFLLMSWTIKAEVYTTYCEGDLTEGICSPVWSGTTVSSGDTVIVNHATYITKNFNINGTLVVSDGSLLTVSGNLKIGKNGYLIVDGILVAKSIDNDGTIQVNGDVTVQGNLINNGTGIIEGAGGNIYVGNNAISNGGGTIRGNINICSVDGSTNPVIANSGHVDYSSVAICGVILPVQLISFKATNTTSGNLLTWVTASEINSDGFEVQRSDNARDFKSIGFVKSSGGEKVLKTYNWYDYENLNQQAYYRLLMIDYDGTIAYSDIVCTGSVEGIHISVFPNPVSSGEFIRIESSDKNDLDVQLIDYSGKVIHNAKRNSEGLFSISTTGINPGLYQIKVSGQSGSEIKPLMVR